MEHDNSSMDALRADLAELTALHGPSGSEQPVIAQLRDRFAPLVDGVAMDHMGNLVATLEGPPGAPHVVVSAHADEIGAVVAGVEPDGFLRLYPVGGVQARLLEGRAVWVGGRAGVIGARSGHLTPEQEHGRGAGLEELYVDLGVDDAAAVEALGVRVGDPVVVLSELRDLAGSRVAGKAIDNRASCVVLLHLLRRLHGRTLPCRLTALVAVQEEVGLRGATAAFERLRPNLAIVVDTAPAGGTPDTRGLAYAARIGGGVLIQPAGGGGSGRGFLMPRAARDVLIAAARRAVPARSLCRRRDRRGGRTPRGGRACHLADPDSPTLLSLARGGAGPARSSRGTGAHRGARAAPSDGRGAGIPEHARAPRRVTS